MSLQNACQVSKSSLFRHTLQHACHVPQKCVPCPSKMRVMSLQNFDGDCSHFRRTWPGGGPGVGGTWLAFSILQRSATRTATYCNTYMWDLYHGDTLRHTVTHCNTLQHTATHCNTLQHAATHCSTLQHSVIHCNALQHTATHCDTLQHTATHCNTPQMVLVIIYIQEIVVCLRACREQSLYCH